MRIETENHSTTSLGRETAKEILLAALPAKDDSVGRERIQLSADTESIS
jgi:hypothetical protein